jgi:TonB family protein
LLRVSLLRRETAKNPALPTTKDGAPKILSQRPGHPPDNQRFGFRLYPRINRCGIIELQYIQALESILPTSARLRFTLFLLVVVAGSSALVLAQESAKTLPEVTEHAAINYPALARQARIQGQVRLRVTTNGHVVTDVAIAEGHPLLAQSAEQNVRTWKFVDHFPATFEVTFDFRILNISGTFLKQPGIVEVVSNSEGGISSYTLPEKWNAQVRDAKGTIETTLRLWTYESFEPELDGYTKGPEGQERAIHEAHIDGNMLGFDCTLYDRYDQRLKFSMIGKMTGDKIKGVFLNYWGTGGTWTAERAAKELSETSPVPPSNVEQTPITASDVAYHEYAGYSSFAIDAGIQGTVKLRVATDGDSVTKIDAESGNPFLVREAFGNLRTWRFADHTPRTFHVIYTYKILDERVDFLKEPGVVEIDSSPPLVNGGGSNLYNPPDIWQAQLTSPRGITRATFSLAMSDDISDDILDGYVIGNEVGRTGKKEEIRQAHLDGNMLGFDATLKGPSGSPLRVSLLGKKTGSKMTGVFLDYSGTPGTWTAVRQPSHAKSPR